MCTFSSVSSNHAQSVNNGCLFLQVLCETMDSHLVEIDSPVEEQFIMQRIYFIERKSCTGLNGRYL